MAIIDLLLAAAAAAPGAANESPYGLTQALREGGAISIATFVILVGMSIGTFYILFTKFLQQQKIINQGKKVRASFWNSPNLREASTKLDSKSAYRSIVEDALVAQDQHSKLTDPVDQHEWVAGSLARSQGAHLRPVSAKASPSSRPSVRPRRSSACSAPSSASTAR